MIKTIDNGILRINGLSFMEFSNSFRGYLILSKRTGRVIPKFLLYWSGLSVPEVKDSFSFEKRINDN
jgi:hypothetical protein